MSARCRTCRHFLRGKPYGRQWWPKWCGHCYAKTLCEPSVANANEKACVMYEEHESLGDHLIDQAKEES